MDGDDGLGFRRREAVRQAVGVMTLVSQKAREGGAFVQKRRSIRDIRVVSGAEAEGHRAPATICQSMDLAGWTTTRALDALILRPPFAPCAEQWARMAMMSMLNSPDSSACAARVAKMRPQRRRWLQRLKRFVDRHPGAIAGGIISPSTPGAQHMDMPLMTRRLFTRLTAVGSWA